MPLPQPATKPNFGRPAGTLFLKIFASEWPCYWPWRVPLVVHFT